MNSKAQRKFRAQDNKHLFTVFQHAAQITSKIEEVSAATDPNEDLPDSLVPTHILYDLGRAYQDMYTMLLDEQLLSAGYPKQTYTTH